MRASVTLRLHTNPEVTKSDEVTLCAIQIHYFVTIVSCSVKVTFSSTFQ
jgi:hypothetical protein